MIASEQYMRALRRLASASLVLVAGCAAETADGPASAGDTGNTSSSPRDIPAVEARSPRAVVTDAVAAAKGCSPLTCCFPTTGAGWEDDPFENALRALGCETPAPYTEVAGSLNWWFYTQCSPSHRLSEVVGEYSGTPYDAQFVTSACLSLHAIGRGACDAVFVKFDPTCETCVAPPVAD